MLSCKSSWRRNNDKRRKNCSYLIYNIASLGKMAGKTKPSNYLVNMVLLWMILNEISAHLQPLDNKVYAKKISPTNIYLFKDKNRDTKKV